MNDTGLFLRFGVALVIGVLVGLQREFAYGDPEHEIPAGIRTYALMGLLGCGSAMLSDIFDSPMPFAAAFLTMGAFSVIVYQQDCGRGKVGLTTRVSALLMMVIGALCYQDDLALPVALGVVTTLLLSIKFETHRLVQHITQADVVATLKFAVITAIIIPVLPNHTYGPIPFDIFNPFKIWLFVVFISSIGFVGYLLVKFAGAGKGIGLTGLFGGIASSTALTVSFTDRSKENPELSKPFAFSILLAWSIMFARLVGVVAVLNWELAVRVFIPLSIAAAVGLLYCLWLYKTQSRGHREAVTFNNPFNLGPAIKFGVVFTLILLAAKSAQYYFGSAGVYFSSAVAGLADVDAIAFTMAKLAQDPGGVALPIAAKAVVLATLSNTVLKGAIIFIWGAPSLKRDILPGFLLMTVTGMVVAFIA